MVAIEWGALVQQRRQLAWLLTHLPGPPRHQLMLGPQAGGVRPSGRLAGPTWTAAAMAFGAGAAALNEVQERHNGKRAG